MVNIPVTTSFSKREVDLECLQSMIEPVEKYKEVQPSITLFTPKIVTGPQKLMQRYVVLFTTITGSDRLRPDDGSRLIPACETGYVNSLADLNYMAAKANNDTRERIIADDNDETFGIQPDDEKLEDCWIDSVVVDKDSRTVSVYASILTRAGESLTFVVPTTAGIY